MHNKLFFYVPFMLIYLATSAQETLILRQFDPKFSYSDLSCLTPFSCLLPDKYNDGLVYKLNGISIYKFENENKKMVSSFRYSKEDNAQVYERYDPPTNIWIENINKFFYPNKSKYNFQVLTNGRDEVRQDDSAIEINIITPWWATFWFRTMLIITTIAIICIFYGYRKMQKIKLLAIRNKIAADLHDEIGSTLSSIIVYSNILMDNQNRAQVSTIAKTIYESSRKTLESMDDIIWSVNPKNDSFDAILIKMRSTSFELLEAINSHLDFTSDMELKNLKLGMFDRRNFYLVFKEALNNVIKYANPNNVIINIKLKNKSLRFMIKDDGIGFNLNNYKEGNGLINMKKRARELKGLITIISTPGKGTEVHLVFPVKN